MKILFLFTLFVALIFVIVEDVHFSLDIGPSNEASPGLRGHFRTGAVSD
jgi:hypothetical protein